jgi:hypothetical protein
LDSPNIIAYVGDTVKIACTTSGNPRPHRKWLVNDEDIYELDYDFKESKNELQILNVTRDLTGSTITCEAWNEDGQTSRDSALLIVKHKNDGQNTLTAELTVKKDMDEKIATFKCLYKVNYKTLTNQNIEIVWKKDGKTLSEDDGSVDFDTLTVKLTTNDDYGAFSCQANDVHNEIESDPNMLVIRPGDFTTPVTTPTITTKEPIREIIVDGNRLFDFQVDSNFDLICQSFTRYGSVI